MSTDTMTPLGQYMLLDALDMPGRKTSVWLVRNRRTGTRLARIEWYTPWRQYVLMDVDPGVSFNNTCLRDIAKFLTQVNGA